MKSISCLFSGTAARLRDTGAVPYALLAGVALLGLAACGGEPLHPSKWQDPPGEVPEGEGLLTGEDGEWTIYPPE